MNHNPPLTTPRYYSLDVFRGATVALMILVNNPGTWGHIYSPLDHAEWHGVTPTDLVFPFFLFAVGNAMAFVMPRFEQKGPRTFWTKVIKRTLLIFLIGLFLSWCPFVKWDGDVLVARPWKEVRILGVLQRIAIAYFVASVIVYYAKARLAFVIGIFILLIYWFLCWWLGDAADPYSLQGFFGNRVDEAILGKTHMLGENGVTFDPEGLTSTLPAIVQVIFGYLVGQYIQQKGKTTDMLSNLFVAGIVLVVAGLAWDMAFPMNKKIWTSSYVVYTTGLAMLTLGVLIHLLEFRNAKGRWSRFFDVFGKNPLFIFVLAGFLPRILNTKGPLRWLDHYDTAGQPVYTSVVSGFYQYVWRPIGTFVTTDERFASMLYAICIIIIYWLIVYLLDRKKIYIKV
jgi:predicted acyltransferase